MAKKYVNQYTAAAYNETANKFKNANSISDYWSAYNFAKTMLPTMAVADLASNAWSGITGDAPSQWANSYKTETSSKGKDYIVYDLDTSTKSSNNASANEAAGDSDTYDYSNLYDTLYGDGGAGGYTPQLIDPTAQINAYNAAYESKRKTAESNYNQNRSDLLTSLKRFQEQNARDVENQKQNYLANQASLDAARAEADRQNRISAASRGISGSGLQQLAQLQNLMNQGQDISNLAKSNQSAMDALRLALSEKEEDTNTAVSNATENYNNLLQTLSSDLATNIANARYQADTYNANAINNARAQAAAASASARSNALNQIGALNYYTNAYNDDLSALNTAINNKDKKTINTLKERFGLSSKATNQQLAFAIKQAYNDEIGGLGLNTNAYNTVYGNLNSIYNRYNFE